MPEFGFAKYAEMLGLIGIRVDAPEQIAPAWDRALAADRPVLYEAVVDPEVPILPPHITVEEAKKLAMSMFKRDPNLPDVIRGAFKDAFASFLPGKK